MNSMETGQINEFENAFSDKVVRQNFIKKVFALLSVQLLISFSAMLIASRIDGFQEFAIKNFWLFFVSIIAAFILVIPMVCVKTLRRRTPHNYILLFSFTGLYSIALAFIGGFSDPNTVLAAIGITGVIVFFLTIFAIQTKIDFTICNGIMAVILMCCVLSGISLLFFSAYNYPLINVAYATIGAIIASLFIVIDVQMIVGGYRSVVISPEEYIYCSLILYIDIIRLFLYILQILQNK